MTGKVSHVTDEVAVQPDPAFPHPVLAAVVAVVDFQEKVFAPGGTGKRRILEMRLALFGEKRPGTVDDVFTERLVIAVGALVMVTAPAGREGR